MRCRGGRREQLRTLPTLGIGMSALGSERTAARLVVLPIVAPLVADK